MAKLNAAELATFYADYVDAWNRCDLDSYYSLYSDRADLVFRDGSTVLHGIDASATVTKPSCGSSQT